MYRFECNKCKKIISISNNSMDQIVDIVNELNQILNIEITDEKVMVVTHDILNTGVMCCGKPSYQLKTGPE